MKRLRGTHVCPLDVFLEQAHRVCAVLETLHHFAEDVTQTRREPNARLAWISRDTLWRSLYHGLGCEDKIDKHYLTCTACTSRLLQSDCSNFLSEEKLLRTVRNGVLYPLLTL